MIPRGFAHGFLGLDKENIVLYSNDNYRSKSNEIGILWNDKKLRINWKKKILSFQKKIKEIFFLSFFEIKLFFLDIHNSNLSKIKRLNYIPVGLGKDDFDNSWLRDNSGKNISEKNAFYGEYTFHYWLWKNELDKMLDNEWVGFCAYRRFWSNKIDKFEINKLDDFLIETPKEWENKEVILGQDIFLNWKFSKLIKHGLKSLVLNPKLIFKKIGI